MERKIQVTAGYKKRFWGYLRAMIGNQIVQPLPEPFDTDAPSWVKTSAEGKDITPIYNDANSLALVSLKGGKVSLMTKRGERLAERLSVEQVFSYNKGDTTCRYEDGVIYIDMPEIEGYTKEDLWLENEVSEGELTGLISMEVEKGNKDFIGFLIDQRFKDYRDERLAGTAFGTISPMDIVMRGARRDLPKDEWEDLRKWFTAAIGLSDSQIQASMIGLCPHNGVINPKYRKFIEPVKEYLFDTNIQELMEGFDPLMSEDKNWLIMQLPLFFGEEQVINGLPINQIDILIGRKYYLKGNKAIISRERIKELQGAIEGIMTGESVSEKDLDTLIDFMQCRECREEEHIVTSSLFDAKPVDKQEGIEKIKIVRKGIEPWLEMLEDVADTSREDFLAVIGSAYAELFEPGFVRRPAGILFPYKNSTRIIAKAPKSKSENHEWCEVKCMEKKITPMGELCIGRPHQPEDGMLFLFYGKAVLNKDIYYTLQKEGSTISIPEACNIPEEEALPVCTQANHERIVEELYKNYKQGKDFTYVPMLLAEFAYGTEYKSREYVNMGKGWSQYKPYITKTLTTMHTYAQALCLIEKAKERYGLPKNATIEKVTQKASEEGLFSESDEAIDARQNLVWSMSDDKIRFINYLRNSLMICSLLRVHERAQDSTKKLIQYRVRISDVTGTFSQEKMDCKNPAIIFSKKCFADSEGKGVNTRELLEPEDVTPSSIAGLTQILETGDLFDVAMVEGTPVFAYKEASLNAINGYYPIWESMPLGRKFDGQPVLNNSKRFLGHIWHMIIAGSRSGKGVMTLTHLAYATLNHKTIIYLDNKPDMYATLVSLLNYVGEPNPVNLGLVNGGKVDEKYDHPITKDTDKSRPFIDRFKAGVLGDVNASWSTMTNKRGEKLIPEYAMGIYSDGEWEEGFGDMVYYRLFTLLNGIVYARIKSQSLEDNLKQFGGMCFFIDEYNQFQSGFESICKTMIPKVMMAESNAEGALNTFIGKEVAKNDSLSDKSDKKVSEEEARVKAKTAFFKLYDTKIGPVNFYASFFFRTIARGLAGMKSLVRAGGVGGSAPPHVLSGLDMYIIGQEPKMAVLRNDIPDSEDGVDMLIGKRYIALSSSKSVGIQGTSDNTVLQSPMYFPMSWTSILQNGGVDVCFGYNREFGRILNQDKETAKVDSPSQSKLTETARYFGYLPAFNLRDTMPKYLNKDDKTAESVKFMSSEAKRATYLKPYLILNDNDHAYTDPLTSNIVGKSGVSKRSIFTTFGDEETRNAIADNPDTPEKEIIHTADDIANYPDAQLIAKYHDGVGLLGYMESMCELMKKEKAEGRTDWDAPESASEAMLESFHKGAELLQFVTDSMKYPGTWIEFLCDMRYSWMFTPSDIAFAILNTEHSRNQIGCLGTRRELGLPVQETWIDKYWKQYADYDPAPAENEEAGEIAGSGSEGMNGYTEFGQEDMSKPEGSTFTEISLDELGTDEGRRKIASSMLGSHSPTGNTQPPTDEIQEIQLAPQEIEQSGPIGEFTPDESAQLKEYFTQNGVQKDLIDQFEEIFNNNKMILSLLARLLPAQVEQGYRDLGKGNLVDTCEQAISTSVTEIPRRTPQTLSEAEFERSRNDYNSYIKTPLITESKALTVAPEENIILGKDLRKPVTEVVYREIGEKWAGMKSLVVNGNEELIVNGKRIRTYFDADSEGYINEDMMDELNSGMIAKYFDYRYLPKCRNLETLVLVDRMFAREYIAPVMGMKGGFNIEDIFAKCPSLKKVYVGEKCYTRKDHKKQCMNDYTTADYTGDVLDNFRYMTLSYKDKQWHALRQDFGNMPKQFAKSSRWEKVFTIGRGIKNVAGVVASTVVGAGLNGISSARRVYQNREDKEK